MTERDQALRGLSQLKQAIVDYLARHPEGCRNSEVAEALGIRSDFEGDQKDYLSYSVLGILLSEKKIRYEVIGKRRRYYVR